MLLLIKYSLAKYKSTIKKKKKINDPKLLNGSA